MSTTIGQLASDLYKAMSESDNKKPKPYDTPAEVVRVDGQTAYVHIPGGVDETPVQRTTNANPGDNVMVRVSGGRAWLLGNSTNPPTDDTTANKAIYISNEAGKQAKEAIDNSEIARMAADSAQESATRAYNLANEVEGLAEQAREDAADAQRSAAEAIESADTANQAANSALTQLGVVEDVVGVLEWISEHATYKASTDTEVVAGKMYFTRSGDTYTPVANPAGNPSTSGYYEIDNIDEAVSNYVSSHLSLTNAGLWVINDNNSYKILLASDGMKVYDASGNLVSTFGESVTFSSTRAQYIGNNTAYIAFDPDGNGGQGSLTIGGSSIQMGNRTLDDVLGNTLIYDHTYEYVRDSNNKPITANFTAFLYRGGVDVKTEYPTTSFTWYLKREVKGTGAIEETLIGTGYTCSVNLSTCGYGAEVVGKFTLSDDANALSTNGSNLRSANNENLSVRATGDSVRVRDLSLSTTIFATDKLMVVGAEDEHLVSIQTLQDYLNANLDKQVLFDTTANWDAQTTLVSDADTLYIYTDHQYDSNGNKVAGIKAGDGLAYVVDLPFTDAIATEHIADNVRHITSTERNFWNNKVRCYYAGTEQLIFTTA